MNPLHLLKSAVLLSVIPILLATAPAAFAHLQGSRDKLKRLEGEASKLYDEKIAARKFESISAKVMAGGTPNKEEQALMAQWGMGKITGKRPFRTYAEIEKEVTKNWKEQTKMRKRIKDQEAQAATADKERKEKAEQEKAAAAQKLKEAQEKAMADARKKEAQKVPGTPISKGTGEPGTKPRGTGEPGTKPKDEGGRGTIATPSHADEKKFRADVNKLMADVEKFKKSLADYQKKPDAATRKQLEKVRGGLLAEKARLVDQKKELLRDRAVDIGRSNVLDAARIASVDASRGAIADAMRDTGRDASKEGAKGSSKDTGKSSASSAASSAVYSAKPSYPH